MLRILEYVAYIGLFFAVIIFFGFIYYRIKNAILIKRYPEHKEEIITKKFFGEISKLAGKVYAALLTAGLFSFMIIDPVFRSWIGITHEQWNVWQLLFFIVGVISYVFSILSIIFLREDDNSNKK